MHSRVSSPVKLSFKYTCWYVSKLRKEKKQNIWTGSENACVHSCSENHKSTAKSQLTREKKRTNRLGKIKRDVSKWGLRPGFLPLAAKLPGLRGGSTSGTIKLSQHQPSQPSGDPHSALMSVMDFGGLKKKKKKYNNSTFYLPLRASRGRSRDRKLPGSAAFRLKAGGDSPRAKHCVVQIKKAIFLLQE